MLVMPRKRLSILNKRELAEIENQEAEQVPGKAYYLLPFLAN